MLYEVDVVPLPLEFGGDDISGVNGGYTEGDEGRRNLQVLERSAHRILSSD